MCLAAGAFHDNHWISHKGSLITTRPLLTLGFLVTSLIKAPSLRLLSLAGLQVWEDCSGSLLFGNDGGHHGLLDTFNATEMSLDPFSDL